MNITVTNSVSARLILFFLFICNVAGAQEQRRGDPANILSESNRSHMDAPKAIYLNYWAAGSSRYRENFLKLIESTEINAVVIDIKNEYGQIVAPGTVQMAEEIGAYQQRSVKDLKALVDLFKQKGLYMIARMVVFKDDLLVGAMPELGIKDRNGSTWRNVEGLAWSDPYIKMVHSYNIAIAKDAVRAGFDEINFDYLRFPGIGSLHYLKPNTEENRVEAIRSFLAQAKETLSPLGAKISVDTFGYVCWNENDTFIGHKLEVLERYADYISPMLYPSSFHLGIRGYADSIDHPYEIVYYTLKNAKKRLSVAAGRFRPWLQAFPDYAFDKRHFGEKEIRAQIDAAEAFGSDGWMLWHPGSYFTKRGLTERTP